MIISNPLYLETGCPQTLPVTVFFLKEYCYGIILLNNTDSEWSPDVDNESDFKYKLYEL